MSLLRICEHRSVLTWVSGLFLYHLGDLGSLKTKILIYNDHVTSSGKKPKKILPAKHHSQSGLCRIHTAIIEMDKS